MDVNILVRGSSVGSEHHVESNSLMRYLERGNNCAIVMDNEDLIKHQYKKRLKEPSYGSKWLKSMLLGKKVVFVDRAVIPQGVRVKLKTRGFDDEDFKYYIRTCANSCCKVIATYDIHFYEVGTILWNKLNIKVKSSIDAEEFARNGSCGTCDV